MQDIRGKRALVTGAGIRVGRAIADALVDAGAHVAFHHHGSASGAEAGVVRARQSGVTAVALEADLFDDAAAQALPARAVEALGGLDLVVNSAALFERVPFEQITAAQLDRLLGLNYRAPFLISQAATPALQASRGCIVNLLDVAAERPWIGYAHYCAAKAALRMLTLGLAKELAAEGVRVNGVRPGLIDTEIHASGGQPDRAARMTPLIPLGRPGRAAEVAAAVLWLLGDGASYCTGSIVDVAGGR